MYEGPLESYSGDHGLYATLHTMFDTKYMPGHETDAFEWGSTVLTMKAGFGTLIPGQVRDTYEFKMQRATGRYTEQIVMQGSERHIFDKAGRCTRIPNTQTPEEAYPSAKPVTTDGPTGTPNSQPDRPSALRWLSSKRYETPLFSALFPIQKPEDGGVLNENVEGNTTDTNIYAAQTEGNAVYTAIGYSDLSFQPDDTIASRDKMLDAKIPSGLTSVTKGPKTDAFIGPIIAREMMVRGVFNGIPIKYYIRVGIQGRRAWILWAFIADLTGHTREEVDSFFDNVIIK